MGGTCSGEHGVGYRQDEVPRAEHGPALDVMRTIKRALDPGQPDEPGQDGADLDHGTCHRTSDVPLDAVPRSDARVRRRDRAADRAQAAPAKTFAWKATGKGGVDLSGRVDSRAVAELLSAEPGARAAFKDSDLLVEEVDLAEMMRSDRRSCQILTRGHAAGDQTLDKVLSPATLALVNKATGDLGAGQRRR